MKGELSRNRTRVRLRDSLPSSADAAGPTITVNREDGCRKLWSENSFVEFDNSAGVGIRNCGKVRYGNRPVRGAHFLSSEGYAGGKEDWKALRSAMHAIRTANPDKLHGIVGDTQWTLVDW
jgi:hypothetical protein